MGISIMAETPQSKFIKAHALIENMSEKQVLDAYNEAVKFNNRKIDIGDPHSGYTYTGISRHGDHFMGNIATNLILFITGMEPSDVCIEQSEEPLYFRSSLFLKTFHNLMEGFYIQKFNITTII